jgi:hypothetical protein
MCLVVDPMRRASGHCATYAGLLTMLLGSTFQQLPHREKTYTGVPKTSIVRVTVVGRPMSCRRCRVGRTHNTSLLDDQYDCEDRK